MLKAIPWLLALTFAIGSFGKFSLFSPDIKIALLDLLVLIINLSAVPKLVKAGVRPHPLIFGIFSFACAALFSLAASRFGAREMMVGLLYLVRWLNYSVLFLTFGILMSPGTRLYTLRLLAITTAVVGLGQYIFIPDIRPLAIYGWDLHYYRVVGSFLDPGYTGLVLVFGLILFTLRPFKNRLWSIITWAGLYLAMSLTYSRSVYLAFLAAFGLLAWERRSAKFFVQMSGLLLLTILLLPRASQGEGVKLERTSSIVARMINWSQAWEIAGSRPLVGVGFNVYRYASRNVGSGSDDEWLANHAGAGSDSSLLLVAATTGAVGLVLYLRYLRVLSKLETTFFFLIPLLVHSTFLNSLFYPPILTWMSLVIASDTNQGE